jgi:hypothetical protein
MAFIRTIPPEEASDALKEMYDQELKASGFIDNGTQTFSLRPEVYTAWANFILTIRKKMRLRRYELVTLAAASALHCTY